MEKQDLTPDERAIRNVKIGHMYRNGATQQAIATKYGITPMRVSQILRETGVLQSLPAESRTVVRMPPEQKQAVEKVASQDGKSISGFMADLAEEEVRRRAGE